MVQIDQITRCLDEDQIKIILNTSKRHKSDRTILRHAKLTHQVRRVTHSGIYDRPYFSTQLYTLLFQHGGTSMTRLSDVGVMVKDALVNRPR